MAHFSSVVVALLALGTIAAPQTAKPTAGPLPAPANPDSIVTWGRARFTVLSPALLRLELAGVSGSFDDRPSMAVVGRSTPTPPFTVETSGNTLFLRTAAVNLTYTSPTGNSTPPVQNQSMCALAEAADVKDGSRVPNYPGGANASSQAVCCGLCDSDDSCTAWIYAPVTPPTTAPGDVPGANCWLMLGVTGTNPSGSRVTGAVLPFTPDELNATFLVGGEPVTWHAGDVDPANLRGAFHAMDCYDTPGNCTRDYAAAESPGLLSRSGWALLDDTASARFVAPDPAVPSPSLFWYANASARTAPAADWYLFASGRDYRATLLDYTLIGGSPSLAPASVYGVWWSHWEAFSQAQFVGDILQGYANYSLPLTHVMLDVDWHTEQSQLNATVPCYSYGGYTVNTALWPDWAAFVAALHTPGASPLNPVGAPLKLMLNLHPQGGTDACQKNWTAFAAAIDYAGAAIVPCTWGNQRIAAASFASFMDAEDLAPVDGWWPDFDYEGDCFDAPTAGVAGSSWPGIAWSNELFGGHQRSARGRRPLVLARSGGVGAHRNPVSFSGDANQHQEILRWELYSTSTAANVMTSWSNDVGGFMCNSIPQAECSGDPAIPANGYLYLRWLQAAASWPVFRTHASEWGLSVMERRVWAFPEPASGAMQDALRLRSALGPYLYAEARHAYDTGLIATHPAYVDWPEDDASYSASDEYVFGRALLAAPVWDANATVSAPWVGPGDNATTAAALGGFRSVYLPPAPAWSDWNGTHVYAGGANLTGVFYALNDSPLFARAGAIIPLAHSRGLANAPDPLCLAVFPVAPDAAPATSSYSLYEDDGDSTAALDGGDAFSRTALNATVQPRGLAIVIGPAVGTFAGALATRGIEVHVRGFEARAAAPASVSANGTPVARGDGPGCAPCWWVVPAAAHSLALPEGTLVVEAGRWATSAGGEVAVTW